MNEPTMSKRRPEPKINRPAHPASGWQTAKEVCRRVGDSEGSHNSKHLPVDLGKDLWDPFPPAPLKTQLHTRVYHEQGLRIS